MKYLILIIIVLGLVGSYLYVEKKSDNPISGTNIYGNTFEGEAAIELWGPLYKCVGNEKGDILLFQEDIKLNQYEIAKYSCTNITGEEWRKAEIEQSCLNVGTDYSASTSECTERVGVDMKG